MSLRKETDRVYIEIDRRVVCSFARADRSGKQEIIMNLIIWIILIAIAVICGFLILQSILQRRAPKIPLQIVMTIQGDPSTSRAFTWHSVIRMAALSCKSQRVMR